MIAAGWHHTDGMDFDRLSQYDRAHVWHPYTRASSTAELPMIVGGEGIRLFAADGRSYVDAISSWWCCALGHGNGAVVDAIRAQAGVLPHSILGNLAHPQAATLAARLAALMPTPDRHVLFASDGASAIEQALKIALQYHDNIGARGRTRFACIRGAYHGDTIGAMALGYQEEWHRAFRPMLAEAVVLPGPDELRASQYTFTAWEAALAPHSGDLAAVLVEPLCLGAAGMKMYPAELLKALADWCRANGVPLIVDEIAMGFGRTGRMFAYEHAGIDPDIVCVGKALSAGYLPISATIVRDAIYDAFSDEPRNRTLQHGHTFCGNPIAAAAANAALDEYARLHIASLAAERGRQLAHRIAPLRTNPRVRDVRSLGLIGVVELKPSQATTATTHAHRIRQRLHAAGILLRPLGDVLYLMPPLTITGRELDDLAGAFVDAIRETP